MKDLAANRPYRRVSSVLDWNWLAHEASAEESFHMQIFLNIFSSKSLHSKLDRFSNSLVLKQQPKATQK